MKTRRKTRESMATFETLVDRRLSSRDMLALLLADHERQRHDLIDLWERRHLHKGDRSRFLETVDAEINRQTIIIRRLSRTLVAMGGEE